MSLNQHHHDRMSYSVPLSKHLHQDQNIQLNLVVNYHRSHLTLKLIVSYNHRYSMKTYRVWKVDCWVQLPMLQLVVYSSEQLVSICHTRDNNVHMNSMMNYHHYHHKHRDNPFKSKEIFSFYSKFSAYFKRCYSNTTTCCRHWSNHTPCIMFNIISFNSIKTCRIIESTNSI